MNFNEEELLQVVARQARKYTSNESTSITYQTARQLMSSVLYCMKEDEFNHTILGDKQEDLELLNRNGKISAMQAFEFGIKRKREKIQKAKELFDNISLTFEDYHNECYQETIIAGMKAFFERYDVNFDATNHLLTLDYPLLCEISELKGIDLIYEYLLRTFLEQKFLAGFDKDEIIGILYAYHKNYKELIINIAKIVLRNALGHMIAGSSPVNLSVTKEERSNIKKICETKSIEKIEKILWEALYQLIQVQSYPKTVLFEYLKNDLHDIAYEMKHSISNHCLEQLFIEVGKEERIQESFYIEGSQMEDEKLRELIEEMNDLTVKERIELIKEKISCLADLKELLKECFYQEECDSVFELLSPEEKNTLRKEIKEKIDFDEVLDDWEKRLIRLQ